MYFSVDLSYIPLGRCIGYKGKIGDKEEKYHYIVILGEVYDENSKYAKLLNEFSGAKDFFYEDNKLKPFLPWPAVIFDTEKKLDVDMEIIQPGFKNYFESPLYQWEFDIAVNKLIDNIPLDAPSGLTAYSYGNLLQFKGANDDMSLVTAISVPVPKTKTQNILTYMKIYNNNFFLKKNRPRRQDTFKMISDNQKPEDEVKMIYDNQKPVDKSEAYRYYMIYSVLVIIFAELLYLVYYYRKKLKEVTKKEKQT
jgi:hypothetical protein